MKIVLFSGLAGLIFGIIGSLFTECIKNIFQIKKEKSFEYRNQIKQVYENILIAAECFLYKEAREWHKDINLVMQVVMNSDENLLNYIISELHIKNYMMSDNVRKAVEEFTKNPTRNCFDKISDFIRQEYL